MLKEIRFFLLAALMMVATVVNAQVTTSSLAGLVTDDQGEVIGASIQAVHTPSGTKYVAITNEKGSFAIRGMRVGGPYTVTVSYIGSQTRRFEDITLALGETYNLNVKMTENTDMLGEVVVVGTKSKFNTTKTGASTNINNEQIVNLPTVSRSITDYTRLSPYGGNGMSFAGVDGRTTNFTVDGADFNNNFGLSSALPGGGNPISIDAIEEMQIVISPYDVRQTNFIGGGLNAITKSGTNTFKGTAYVYHKNENMQGDAVYGEQIQGARAKDRKTTYGFTLGGPIIKNKLFFFANYEESVIPTIVNRWRGSVDGKADATNYISRTKLSDLQTVSEYVKNKYGYDTGSWTDWSGDQNNRKILARIDWNITNNHHLSLRYNHTKNHSLTPPNATSMDGGARASGARVSQYSMSFANSMYSDDKTVNSWVLDLNSRFGNNLSNQLLATYTKIGDPARGSSSSEFPFIDILDGEGQNYMALGYELFTWNNGVHNDVAKIKDDITYHLDKHKITAGVAFEYQMADNVYMRNGTGYYRYKTLNDFLTGAAPEVVCLTYGYNGESNPGARVTFNKLGVYLQDEWQVNKKFNVTAGVRFDDLIFNDKDIMTNSKIYSYDYNGRHIDTGKWPSSGITISPRVGFTYDVLGNKSLVVRGGTGLFVGRLPLVFFTNMPTNAGMFQNKVKIGPAKDADKMDMNIFAGGLVTDANGKATIDALKQKLFSLGYPETISPDEGSDQSSFIGIDPDFKMPQVWKSSLAVDYSFPTSFPLSITGEFIFNKNLNAASLTDWSIKDVGGFARFNGVDNRPVYPADYNMNKPAAILTNTSKGYGWIGSVTVNARPTDKISLMAAYTHTVNKEITGMPGSDATSAMYYVPTVEGSNYIRRHNSQYVTPDRFVVSGTFNDKCGNSLSLIYEATRGGYNYSYMTTGDMNGDGNPYDLIYIPTDEQVKNREFRFKTQDDLDRFMAFVHKDSYLKNHQGEYAEAYSLYNPWLHRVDLSYKHDFKLCTGNTTNKLQLSLDIKNFLNIFSSKWGVGKILNPAIGSEARILKYEGVDADGYAFFSTPSAINGDTETFMPSYTLGQCWYASIGVKYIFEGKRSNKDCGCDDKGPRVSEREISEILAKNNALKAANDRLTSLNQQLANENDKLKNSRKADVQERAVAMPLEKEPKIVEKVVEKTVTVSDKYVVNFAISSAELTAEAKAVLDKIPSGSTVSVVGLTSPDGSTDVNTALSAERANSVAAYLKARGVNVQSAVGAGEPCRIAVVSIM